MIKTEYYNNKGKTIYECDRCHKLLEKDGGLYRVGIHSYKSNKTVKTLHLCKRCVKISLAIVNKGVKD